jgi:hypothetical protein
MKHKISIKKALVFLLIIAASMRVISCCKYVFIDEATVFYNILNFIEKRTIMPSYFNYPTFFSYLSIIPTCLVGLVLYIKGILTIPQDFAVLAYYLDSILPYLGARITSLVFGLLTILLLFKIGNRFFDKRTGLIAAAFLAFSKLHIYYSGYALPEVTMTFFATCSLFFSLSALRSKSIRDYVLAGVFAGFTCSTKYNGALIILLILTTHLIHLYDEKRLLSPYKWINRKIIFSGMAFICAFFISSPGWILSPAIFWKSVVFEHAHMITGHLGSFGTIYIRHLILFWTWERIISVFFGLGLFYAMFRHTRQDIAILTLTLLSFFYIGSWQKKSLHYLIFLYPALSLLSARLISDIISKISERVLRTTILFIVFSIFSWQIYSVVMYTYQKALKDNRDIALGWIQSNIPEGSRVIIDWAYTPRLLTVEQKETAKKKNPAFFEKYLRSSPTYELILLKYTPGWLEGINADYLITSSGCFDRFFKTSAPPLNNPLFSSYKKRRDTYASLFYEEEGVGWKLITEFHKGSGPTILIYRREKISN